MNNYAVTIVLTKIVDGEVLMAVGLSTEYCMTEKLAIIAAMDSDLVKKSLLDGYDVNCKLGMKLHLRIA